MKGRIQQISRSDPDFFLIERKKRRKNFADLNHLIFESGKRFQDGSGFFLSMGVGFGFFSSLGSDPDPVIHMRPDPQPSADWDAPMFCGGV